FMRTPLAFVALVALPPLALGMAGPVGIDAAQSGGSAAAPIVSPPTPAPITKHGLTVEIRDVVRLPDTRGMRPLGQDVTPAGGAPTTSGAVGTDGGRFPTHAAGFLQFSVRTTRRWVHGTGPPFSPTAILNRLESGLIGFTFHPEFARNGLFYTVHGESANGTPAMPNFIPPGFTRADVTYHNVITEWHATNPAANTFEGTRRELLRVGHVVANLTHPMGDVEFNPTAKPGAPDYGLLYTSGSDLGFSNGGGPHQANPGQAQRLDTVIGCILRIDPRSPAASGGAKGLGDYTIPAINKFAADGDPKTLGEIFAYGFRNAHRLSWDLIDGTM